MRHLLYIFFHPLPKYRPGSLVFRRNFKIKNQPIKNMLCPLTQLEKGQLLESSTVEKTYYRGKKAIQSRRNLILPRFLYEPILKINLQMGGFLDDGGFASCYRATDFENKDEYALKIVPKCSLSKPDRLTKVMREISLHYYLKHPNIVQLLSGFEDPNNIYMVLEYCQEQSLVHLLSTKPGNRICERSTVRFMRQLVQGVQFLHDEVKILHRDLKLGNLLLCHEDESTMVDPPLTVGQRLDILQPPNQKRCRLTTNNNEDCWGDDFNDHPNRSFNLGPYDTDFKQCRRLRLKICDFGLAIRMHDLGTDADKDLVFWDETAATTAEKRDHKMSLCGTPNYIAPEVLQRLGHSIASESWAAGCIMYAMLFGRPPFETDAVDLTYKLILAGRYNLYANVQPECHQVDLNLDRVSHHARRLIALFLHPNADCRPRFDRALVFHPFFRLPQPPVLETLAGYGLGPYRAITVLDECLPASQVSKLGLKCTPADYYSNSPDAIKKSKIAPESEVVILEPVEKAFQFNSATVLEKYAVKKQNGSSHKQQLCSTSSGDSGISPSVASAADPSRSGGANKDYCSRRGLQQQRPDITDSCEALYGKKSLTELFDVFLVKSLFVLQLKLASFAEGGYSAEQCPPTAAASPTLQQIAERVTYVTKWLDYSNRHGLGFSYDSGEVCIKFNDGFILMSDFTRRQWCHVCLPAGATLDTCLINMATVTNRQVPYFTLDLANYDMCTNFLSPNLFDKVTALNHFIHYMEVQLIDPFRFANQFTTCHNKREQNGLRNNSNSKPFLRLWRRGDNYIAFVFTDGTFQINFTDNHVKLVFNPLTSALASYCNAKDPVNANLHCPKIGDYIFTYLDRINSLYISAQFLSHFTTSFIPSISRYTNPVQYAEQISSFRSNMGRGLDVLRLTRQQLLL